MADTDTGTETSGAESDKADVFRDAERRIDRNNKRIRITVIYRSKCFGEITGMDGVTQASVYSRFFGAVRQGKRGDQLMSYQRTKAVSGCTVGSNA